MFAVVKPSIRASCVDLTLRNTRRYGGYIVHLGMVMIFIGLAGQAFNKEVEKEVPIGSTVVQKRRASRVIFPIIMGERLTRERPRPGPRSPV
jgi:uncharacterized membrane protein